MQQILYVFINFIKIMIVALQMLMFVRAIMSWIMMEEENTFTRFLNLVTDPIIMPVRMLLEKVEFIRNMPMDISFFVAFLILVIIQNILPNVVI